MIVLQTKGDIFDTNITHIAHGCNTRGVMGAGVAKIVKERYPEAFTEYKYLCTVYESRPESLLGFNQIVKITSKRTIVNMFTQNFMATDRRAVNYEAIAECFRRVNNDPDIKVIAIPMIGAGLAGGNWEVISRIINDETPDTDVVVFYL